MASTCRAWNDRASGPVRPLRTSRRSTGSWRAWSMRSRADTARASGCARVENATDTLRHTSTQEADAGYGFHLTNSWERWQLLNFYKHVFGLRDFDPEAMAAAKESGERGGLERYLDTLVPDARRKLRDRKRADHLLFPTLDGRLAVRTVIGEDIPHCHLPCGCKRHDVVGPPGIYLSSGDRAGY